MRDFTTRLLRTSLLRAHSIIDRPANLIDSQTHFQYHKMSDSETPAPSHPTHGGKSLQSLERPRYKSWRKKYRKMRYKFDGVLEENKKLFKDEQKLEGIAKRLREELEYV